VYEQGDSSDPGDPLSRRPEGVNPGADLIAILAASIDEGVTTGAMGAPYETAAEIRAAAEIQVAEITARIKDSNQAGGLKQVNAQYKRYRQGQIAKAEKAVPYAKFLERFTASIVRQVAATGRPI
jgi:hypothetical protein